MNRILACLAMLSLAAPAAAQLSPTAAVGVLA